MYLDLTPKEKAYELVGNFCIDNYSEENVSKCKVFARLAVFEILKAIDWDYYEGSVQTEHNYWKQVEQEINNL